MCVPDNKLEIVKLVPFSMYGVLPSTVIANGAIPSVLTTSIAKLPSLAQASTSVNVILGEVSKPTTTILLPVRQLFPSFT